MTLGRLAELVAAFGAAPHRWPEAERGAAKALILVSREAAALVKEARALDAALDIAPAARVPEALVARIMAARPSAVAAAIPAYGRAAGGSLWRALLATLWPHGSPAFAAGALAASITLGVCVGIASPVAVNAFDQSETTAATSSAGEQLVSLALAENDYPEEWKR